MQLSILHNEEYLGVTLPDDIPSLLIATLSEECINCGALEEHSRTKHNCCQYRKLSSFNYIDWLNNLFSTVIPMLRVHFRRLANTSEQWKRASQ